jgi:hypothetical protein
VPGASRKIERLAVLNIVILHCHYERGGVTQVVENHVRSLRDREQLGQIVLLSGARVGGLTEATREAVQHVVIDDFDYDQQSWPVGSHRDRGERICREIIDQLSRIGIDSHDTILHWHNHGLGKNTAAPEAIARLAQQGWKLLLQIHDFAEDNRPENYARLIQAIGAQDKASLDRYLYPVASQVHYCTLTNGDADVLKGIGIPASQIGCLANSVTAPIAAPTAGDVADSEALEHLRKVLGLPSQARWSLYPVRGIRRKNVGEFLLISQLAPPDRFCGLTLCPATPVEKRSYLRWRTLASDLAPRAVFDAGEHPDLSFFTNLQAADYVISTSVAEGFGMAFLEPWLLRREVIARRLTNVTNDFEANGMHLPKFYDSISIPGQASWISEARRQLQLAAADAWKLLPENFRPSHSFAFSGTDSIDFALLTSRLQTEVLQNVAADDGYRRDVMSLSATLVRDLQSAPDPSILEANASVVKTDYSIARVGERLHDRYQALLSAPLDDEVVAPAEAGRALDLINQKRPFYPCRTENEAGECE